jgi:Biopolymer transport protein
MARPVDEINAGSMADIAFLMLIFFLVTTTMDTDAGLQRRLPPMPVDEKQESAEINRRNMLVVLINTSDRISAAGQPIDITMLNEKVKEFVLNPNDDPALPEKEVKEIENFGAFPVSKGILSLTNDRGTSYEAYIRVQNELVRAFNEIRDDFAMQHYGKPFKKLDEIQQKVVSDIFPQSISEAEPRDVTKKR